MVVIDAAEFFKACPVMIFITLPISILLPSIEKNFSFSPEEWNNFYLIIFSSIMILFFLLVIKKRIEKWDLENQPGEEETCQRNITYGLLAMTFIYWIAMIVYTSIGPHSLISTYTFYVSLISCALIMTLIVLPKVCEISIYDGAKTFGPNTLVVLLLHFFLMFIWYQTSRHFKWRSLKEDQKICFAQVILSVLSSPVITFNLLMMEFGFDLRSVMEAFEKEWAEKKKSEELEYMVSESDSSDDETEGIRLPELDCKICFEQFNSKIKKHTPRMLKECGHTICQECAVNLLKECDGLTIECPFCKKLTSVRGSVRKLPKNFTLITVMEAIKKLELKSS